MRRRDLSYREINSSRTLRDGLLTAILYDVVAFPIRVLTTRKQQRALLNAEQAQLAKREARRRRRASARGTKSAKEAGR